MLKLEDVSKVYSKNGKKILALDGVSLQLEPGSFGVVRGPSGSGKSTLLLTAGVLLRPDSGTVAIDGEDPYRFPPNQRALFRAQRVGFVFQQFHLVPYLTVTENVCASAVANGSLDAKTQERATFLLERFGMSERADHLPGELSTGECQRTALARAMLNAPPLILADEPTGNLDPENSKIVYDALSEFTRGGGTVLVVTHHADAEAYADQAIHLVGGKIESDS
jgi:putative ABC transport system ATP-binding protein